MVAVARTFARFLHVESCGQCGACKTHSGAISDLLARVEHGAADDHHLEEIGARLRIVTDQNRCHVPVELQTVVASTLRAFPDEFVARLEGRPRPARLHPLPKIVDLAGGTVTYDRRAALEQPDWTYPPLPTPERRAG